MGKSYIKLDTWNRKEHFLFFKDFTEPFFGVTVDVDCTAAYNTVKNSKTSFFLYYLHKSLKAANRIEEFAYRVENDQVVKYDRIDPAPTIGRPDGTFGFSYFKFEENFETFEQKAQLAIDKTIQSKALIPGESQNVIYYSALPWLKFTSLSHARDLSRYDSIPKISFGKLSDHNGQKIMPMSIHVNHALADGYHVGKYVDLFQKFMNEDA